MDKKKISIVLWGAFVVCLIATVALWFAMNNTKAEYEEVSATVLSAKTEQVVNKKTHSTTNFYKVTVSYEGEEYDLGNAHSTYEYPVGKTVKAYLSNGKLYANVEGVQTDTPVAKVYFAFLIGTFVLLMGAAMYSSSKPKNVEE